MMLSSSPVSVIFISRSVSWKSHWAERRRLVPAEQGVVESMWNNGHATNRREQEGARFQARPSPKDARWPASGSPIAQLVQCSSPYCREYFQNRTGRRGLVGRAPPDFMGDGSTPHQSQLPAEGPVWRLCPEATAPEIAVDLGLRQNHMTGVSLLRTEDEASNQASQVVSSRAAWWLRPASGGASRKERRHQRAMS